MHCPTCSTPLQLIGMALDGRAGQYKAQFICRPCIGEEVVSIDAAVSYAITAARPRQAFFISEDKA